MDPIIVDDRCLIRAEFHKIEKKYPYEIIITPKMSFGTGHHQTTYLMIKNQLDIDHSNKRVMDAGCGTAILSIMASKRNANEVVAFDIDEKAQEICRGSARTNGVAGPFEVRGLCQAADLRALVGTASSPLLVVDCEGYETTLLEAAEPLAHCDLIVECHDFTDRNLTETLKGRFAGTHDIALVREGPRDPSAFPMLSKLSSFERWLMVCEWRPEVMHWLVLSARRG